MKYRLTFKDNIRYVYEIEAGSPEEAEEIFWEGNEQPIFSDSYGYDMKIEEMS